MVDELLELRYIFCLVSLKYNCGIKNQNPSTMREMNLRKDGKDTRNVTFRQRHRFRQTETRIDEYKKKNNEHVY